MGRLTRIALDHPALTLALILVVTAGFASRALVIRSETGYRAYLGADHPAIQELDRIIEGFGGGLPMAAAWSCNDTPQCETVFDETALEMARSIVEAVEPLPGVRRVESPATTRLLVATEDTIGSDTAWNALDEGRIARFREQAVQDPFWKGMLVSEDATSGMVVIELASSNSQQALDTLAVLQDALAPYEEAGFHFHIVGQTAQFALTDASLAADSSRLTPVTMALVALVVFVLFRSWQTVVASLATVGLSSLWTLGTLGLFDWPQNSLNQAAVPLILVIALCDGIHILSRYAAQRARSGAHTRADRRVALVRATQEAGAPCLATSLSTAVGFLSFAASDLASLGRFGILSALGITYALVLAFTVLPILMLWLPADRLRAVRASALWERALAALVSGTRQHARAILVGSVALLIVFGLGALQLWIDVDEYKLYGENSAAVRGFRFLEEHLHKPDTVEIELRLPAGQNLYEPETLARLDRFRTSLDAIDVLGPVRSILDAMSWTNRLLHEDDGEFQRLGHTLEENGMLIGLLSFSDPELLDRWVSPDLRRIRFSVEAEKRPQSERAATLAQVRAALEKDLGREWEAALTGSFPIYHDLVRDIQRTQLSSFGIAAVVVFLVLVLFLRSLGGTTPAALGWGLVGMFPTLLPVVVTFGVMGFASIHLDMGTAMVAAIVIGIGVDDTMHLLAEFYRRRGQGTSPAIAVEGAVLHVGQAVITTSIALSLGFFALLFSSWQSISSFGFLSAVAILGALAADLFVLPAAMLVFTGSAGAATPSAYTPAESPPSTRSRVALSILALIPVLLVGGAAAFTALPSGDRQVLACRTMPNGAVPLIAGTDPRCPLQAFDRVVAIETPSGRVPAIERAAFLEAVQQSNPRALLIVERDEASHSVHVPVLTETREDRVGQLVASLAIAALALSFALRVYWQSRAAAAPALLILFGVMSGEILSILCASHGDLVAWVSAANEAWIAASLVHLGLTFPQERALVRVVPRIVLLPYLAAVVLGVGELRGLATDATFWLLSVEFLLVAIAGAGVLLWVSALRSARQASSPLERIRARLLLVSSLGVPLILGGSYLGWGRELPGGHIALLFVGISVFALPIGYAITRYDLFDFGPNVRRALDGLLRVGALGLAASGLGVILKATLGLQGPTLWGWAAIGGFLLAEFTHSRLKGVLWSHLAPELARRQQLLAEQGRRSAELLTDDTTARILGTSLETGLEVSGAAVLLCSDEGWRPAYVGRERPWFQLSFARAADLVLKDRRLVHLVRGDVPDSPEADLLRSAGVEVVASIDTAGVRLGVVLVGRRSSGGALSSDALEFIRTLSDHAAVGLLHARHAAAQAAEERQATVERVIAGVAHDLGSPLRVIELRSQRVAERADYPELVRDEAEKLHKISQYLLGTVYGMVKQLKDRAETARLRAPVEEVVEQAILSVSVTDSKERVLVSLPPGLPSVLHPSRLARALGNLIENALYASSLDEPVWVYATLRSGELRLEVQDRGCGMDAELVATALVPQVTSREPAGGTGLGLAITAEIVRDLGGRLELQSEPGVGTQAVIVVPVERNG